MGTVASCFAQILALIDHAAFARAIEHHAALSDGQRASAPASRPDAE